MAAVAAEPGAAAVPTTTATAATDEDGPAEPVPVGPGHLGAPAEANGPAAELSAPRAEDGADGEGRHVRPELEPAAGKAPPESDLPGDRVGLDRFSPGAEHGGGGPYAVFLHSFPDPPPVTEAGLSLAEPAEPNSGGTEELSSRGGHDSTNPPGRSPKRRPAEDSPRPEPVLLDLSPGTEVRVSLDHVIDDALVVSFRLGEQVFSGVLMDVSKRFGPYGIPITVFPRRDDRSRLPISMQPVVGDNAASTKQEEDIAMAPPSPPPPTPSHSWPSKPPPLFQEGAPYPPPLFIRDTYNQALPQPPARKIKRPKRRYRCEEPTSIMNAIKLRPRQVLCDKCKGVVASGGYREARRGSVDLRSEEASRRRRAADGPISSEVKRLRNDDKAGRVSSSSSRRVLRGVASSSSRLKLNSEKVLNKGSAERSKAQQVLGKLARSPPAAPQKQDHSKAVTRAAALQNQKVHLTRRLQRLGGAAISGHSGPPPRMRLKPQSTTLKSC